MNNQFRPREWQSEFLEEYQRQRRINFLLEACVSAGKTPGSVYVYESLKDDYGWKFLVAVVPSEHLQRQFAEDAWHFFKLNLYYGGTNKTVKELIRDGYEGLIVTYQFLANNSCRNASTLQECLKEACSQKVFVIIDEVHHASDKLAFGQACEIAFPDDVVARRLMTTGTPYRSDNNTILGNWLVYEPTSNEEEGKYECFPHFKYAIDRALADGIIPAFFFATLNGKFTWKLNGCLYEGKTFETTGNQQELSYALRTAIDSQGGWITEAIKWAHDEMNVWRAKGFHEVATYVRARTIQDAYLLARRIKAITGEEALVVVSDTDEGAQYASIKNNKNPSELIKEFAQEKGRNCRAWIVAVGILGEGVSINRLVYKIHATNIIQRLSFMQDLGRLLRPFPTEKTRLKRFMPVQVLIPSHPTLIELAKEVLTDIAHVIPEIEKEMEEDSQQAEEGNGNRNSPRESGFMPLDSTGEEGDHILASGDFIPIYFVQVARWAMEEDGWHDWLTTPAELGQFFQQRPEIFAPVEAKYKEVKSTTQLHESSQETKTEPDAASYRPLGFSAEYPKKLPKQKAEEASRRINDLVKKLVKALDPELDTKSEKYGKECRRWHSIARNSNNVPQKCQDHQKLEKVYDWLSTRLDRVLRKNSTGES